MATRISAPVFSPQALLLLMKLRPVQQALLIDVARNIASLGDRKSLQPLSRLLMPNQLKAYQQYQRTVKADRRKQRAAERKARDAN